MLGIVDNILSMEPMFVQIKSICFLFTYQICYHDGKKSLLKILTFYVKENQKGLNIMNIAYCIANIFAPQKMCLNLHKWREYVKEVKTLYFYEE